MTLFEILITCIGFLALAIIFALIGILVAGVVWWMLTKRVDLDMDIQEQEEEQ